jgi:hypothetical protein
MTEMDLKSLNTKGRKTLRIYGPIIEQGIWRIRTDQKQRETLKRQDWNEQDI